MKVRILKTNMTIYKGKIKHDYVPTHIKTITVDKFDPDEIINEVGICGHGIILQPIDDIIKKSYMTLSFGWLIGTSTEISNYIFKNNNKLIWE